MKKDIVAIFNEWKSWFEEHEHTPRYHSKVYEEKHLAHKMQNCITYIRNHPGDYDYILEEYKRIQQEYNHVYYCRQELRVSFNQWKTWAYEHEILPKVKSQDENERRLAIRIGSCIQCMRKKPKEYETELNEYEEIYSLYGVKKSPEERITEWKTWVIEHKKLPRRTGKGVTPKESKMAYNVFRIYKMMLENPDKYKELLAEYESIQEKYYVPVESDTPLDIFLKWKDWVLEHELLPAKETNDEQEANVGRKIQYAIKILKREPTENAEILREYKEISQTFSKGRIIKKQKEKFQKYKLWIIQNETFPKNGYVSIEQKRLSEKMYKLFRVMKRNPELFKQELAELELLHKKYSHSKSKTILQNFKECKEWIYLYERFPKSCSDKLERSLKGKLRRCIKLMNESPDVFASELAEHQKLLSIYGQDALDIKDFNLWKEWTLQNGVIPSSNSPDLIEQELATKVSNIISRYKNKPEKHEVILKEYDFLCSQYNRKRANIKKNLLVFEKWEDWCLTNERIPKAKSEDKEEALLYADIKRCIPIMRKKPAYYEDVLKRYKKICERYKNDK